VAVETSRQPKRGFAVSRPTGSVRRSVVRPAGVTGEPAPGSGAATSLRHGPVPYAPRSLAAVQVCGTESAACQLPSVTRSTVLCAVATRTRPRTPAGPALVLRAAIVRVLLPGLRAAARST
jgi:hypothetical protein